MSRKIWKFDWPLLIPVAILVVLSLTTLFSINFSLFRTQLLFLIASVLVFIFFSFVNYKIIQVYSVPIYVFSLIALFLVLILGIETRGSVRWIEFLGFRAQFSEILKPFLAISFSSFLITRKNSLKQLSSVFMFLAPILLFIFLQRCNKLFLFLFFFF